VVRKNPDPVLPEAADDLSRETLRGIEALNQRLTQVLQPFTADVQAFLDGIEGRSFGLAANKSIVLSTQLLLQRLGLRVRCPHCGEPAILRCRSTRNAKGGSFQFEHSARGKQTNHGGGTTFPAMRLVPAPPDKRRKRKKRR
jgi:predicted RNA-binding Zn-ribbon protein involved in translation (DUF1610 family)